MQNTKYIRQHLTSLATSTIIHELRTFGYDMKDRNLNKYGYVKAYSSGRWAVMFCTGGFKWEGMRREESVICGKYFEGSASVWIVSENILRKSGIRDRFY